jgi:serine/threonine protein kinase
MASQGFEEDLLRRWFPETEKQTEPTSFTEKDIRDISSILERADKEAWSRIPRIYIVLRLINQLSAIDDFVRQDISDTWFPFTQRRLPDCLRGQSDRADFLEIQKLVCNTKALNLEKAGAHHGHFRDPSEIPLKKIGELGKGGSGFVERVISTVTHREYALKLIKRGETFRKDRKVLMDFENELSNLKKLSLGHKHIIDLIGSYTEPKYVGILFPVADCNLAVLLERAGIDDRRWSLRSYFGCLTSALGFLHDNKIRHKDIKPQNILIKDDEPCFTDFGVSVDWTEYGQSTTIGPTALTPRYAAPEVAASEPRNSSSDIWSLGCVFLEIWTALKGAPIKELTEHWTIDGRLMPYYSGDVDTTVWMDRMYALDAPLSDNLPLEWIKPMLERDGKERFSAHLVVEKIREYSGDPSVQYLYIGRCCLDDEDTAESVTSHAEDGAGDVTIKPASAPLATIRSSNKKPAVPLADTSKAGDTTDSLPKPVARKGNWLATESATLVPSEDNDETRTQDTRRKKKSRSEVGVPDVVVQYTVDGNGDTYFPAQLASAKILYELGYAYERHPSVSRILNLYNHIVLISAARRFCRI